MKVENNSNQRDNVEVIISVSRAVMEKENIILRETETEKPSLT
jgi:hypothetical protein